MVEIALAIGIVMVAVSFSAYFIAETIDTFRRDKKK